MDSHHPLRNRTTAAYLVASFTSLAFFYLLTVSVLWQVYELTANVANVGFASLCQFLPAILLYPIVGQLADRFEKRMILVLCASIALFVSVALIFVAAEGKLSVVSLFVAVALAGSIRSFEATALASWLPEFAPISDLSRIIALVSGVKQTAKIGAPALSGFLLVLDPTGMAVFTGMAVLAVLTLVSLLVAKASLRTFSLPETNDTQDLWLGIRYIAGNQALAGALLLDLVAGLFGGFTALLPVFAKEVLLTDAAGAGLLRSMVAMGSLAGALLLATIPLRNNVGRYLISTVGFVGFCTLLLATTRSFPVAATLVALFGAFDSISVNIRNTFLQIGTPNRLRGRVSATNQVSILVSNQLGEFRSGMMASFLGVTPTIALGGAVTVLAALLWGRAFPKLRALRRYEDAQAMVSTALLFLILFSPFTAMGKPFEAKTMQAKRFVPFLSQVRKIFDEPDTDKLVDNLIAGGRTYFFSIEGLARPYKDRFSGKIGKLHSEAKDMEDIVGESVDIGLEIQYAKDVGVPDIAIKEMRKEQKDLRKKLIVYLRDEGWIETGGKKNRLKKWESWIEETKWDDPETDQAFILDYLIESTHELMTKKWDMEELEKGVHEFRRRVRWLTITCRVFADIVALDDFHMGRFEVIHKDKITESPFAKLPFDAIAQNPIKFPTTGHLEIIKAVEVLGDAKDSGQADLVWLPNALFESGLAASKKAGRELAKTFTKRHPKYLPVFETAKHVYERLRLVEPKYPAYEQGILAGVLYRLEMQRGRISCSAETALKANNL